MPRMKDHAQDCPAWSGGKCRCEVHNPKPEPPKALHDLPIFGWAWREDARDVERG